MGNSSRPTRSPASEPRCATTKNWQLAREHNNAQVISIGARMTAVDEAKAMVATFLATPFSNDPRHVRRLEMVAAYERDGVLPPLPSSD